MLNMCRICSGVLVRHPHRKSVCMKQNLAMLAEHIPENEKKLLSVSFGRIFGAIETLTLYPLPDLHMCARAPGMALVDFREAMTADHMLANFHVHQLHLLDAEPHQAR